jgi:hypothetical protein
MGRGCYGAGRRLRNQIDRTISTWILGPTSAPQVVAGNDQRAMTTGGALSVDEGAIREQICDHVCLVRYGVIERREK